MSSLVSSVGNMVEAGVKGLIGLAENYYTSEEESGGDDGASDGSASGVNASTPSANAKPVPINNHERFTANDNSTTALTSYSTSSSTTSSSIVSKPIVTQGAMVQILDVPSGWIHLQSTYLDGAGARKVRSFGLKNLADTDVDVTVGSDLDNQILFWASEEEKPASSSSSSVSSTSNNPGTSRLNVTVPASSTTTIYLSFQPSRAHVDTPPREPSPSPSDGGYTPRIQAGLSESSSLDVSPVPSISKAPSEQSVSSSSASGGGGSQSGHSSLSVAPHSRTGTNGSGAGPSPIHRAFSVHGSISIHASEVTSAAATPMGLAPAPPSPPSSTQMLTLPFFATVCRSLFTAALIDPVTALATGPQLSSGQLLVDFGGDPVVGNEYHRDILLVNRSEIELVWNTAVVNSRSKDSVWFSLRDLDSENVFGVDHSGQPVALPALSSRHLRLELRVKAPITEFDFDFVLSNVHQLGNTVTCRAVGSGQAEGTDDSLKIVSGHTLDFGQVHDGVWAKKMVTCKNAGDRPLDVNFSATQGYDVVFRLAGVAGDDMDEDLTRERKSRATEKTTDGHSRTVTETSRGKDYVASLRSSRPNSPSRSHDAASSTQYESSDGSQYPASEIINRLTASRSEASHGGGSSVGGTSNIREASRPPSQALSRVASHTSSHRFGSAESDDEDDTIPPFFGGDAGGTGAGGSLQSGHSSSKPVLDRADTGGDSKVPNQIEEITMRPGTEYRIFVLYRPARDTTNPPEVAGSLRSSTFKVYLESAPSGSRSTTTPRFKRSLTCTAESCTSLIELSSGSKVDFGEVTVGASKSSTLSITNLSALSAKVEIAAISKVLNTNRSVIIIPPRETVEEKIEFFPRRINDKYEKQIFVRNLLNRSNDQLVEIKSKNIDTYNLTLHSHLYRILTPSGSNFLDFASVVINSPTVRTVVFENLCQTPLLLELSASQPEDVELFLKAEDAPMSTLSAGKYAAEHANLSRVISPPNGELKERFMETMRELSGKDTGVAKPNKGKGKSREKSGSKPADDTTPKQSVGAAIAAALRKGGRGRPVQLYGNAVVFKDRNLLESHEYLDLAAGPPVSAHRTSPRSKKFQLLDSIEFEDKSKLSGQHPKVPKLDFAAGAKATGLHRKEKEGKMRKSKSPLQTQTPTTPTKADRDPSTISTSTAITSTFGAIARVLLPDGDTAKSPALTAKRAESKTDVSQSTDVNKMTVEDLLVAIEQHDSSRASSTHSTLEEEEQYVRRSISLRKEMASLTASDKLVSAQNISVPPGASRQLIVVMTPNGSTRPHITTRAKRADSRIYIKLLDFDRSKLSNANTDLADLPVRDLIIRSSCVRSVLEVQQRSINFGTCEKGEVKSKTIVIHNKSDAVGLFRLRTSGSIASGDLKLGLGRYGVISAFGRKEVENFSFTPSLTGTYNENIVVENVLDGFNDQNVAVKANVRKAPTFTVEPVMVDFGIIDTFQSQSAAQTTQSQSQPIGTVPSSGSIEKMGFTLTNVSKHERTFVVEVKLPGDDDKGQSTQDDSHRFVDLSLSRDEVGTALSKGEEEEIENIQQKLRIAKRKGKKDKIEKYEARLVELGVHAADASDVEDGVEEGGQEDATASLSTVEPAALGLQPPTMNDATGKSASDHSPGAQTPAVEIDAPEYGPKHRVSSLTIVLQPNQKNMVLVELIPKSPTTLPLSSASSSSSSSSYSQPSILETVLQIHDKKNADESQSVKVIARRPGHMSSDAMNSGSTIKAGHPTSYNTSNSSSIPSAALPLSDDPLHIALMRHCLQLTHQCPVSPTAFCVGSCLFLPASSPLYTVLAPFFTPFHLPSDEKDAIDPAGLILSNGYSREIPGNTHAEANALTNFQSRLLKLHSSAEGRDLPSLNDISPHVDCYATMEPCSIRTSGGPSCATELVKAGVKRVWLGVEEPLDFVQCDGVNILLQGNVEVGRVTGLEEDCLKAARRGRD